MSENAESSPPKPPETPKESTKSRGGNSKRVFAGALGILTTAGVGVGINKITTTIQHDSPPVATWHTSELPVSPLLTQPSPEETHDSPITNEKIEAQIKSRIGEETPFTISEIQQYSGDWLLVEITHDTTVTDPLKVIMKLENGQLVTKEGPGTSFDEKTLQEMAAPPDLIMATND